MEKTCLHNRFKRLESKQESRALLLHCDIKFQVWIWPVWFIREDTYPSLPLQKNNIAENVTESSRFQGCLGFFDAWNFDAFPAGMFFRL